MIRLTPSHVLLAAVAWCAAFTTRATTLFEMERTCPVGGEKYQSVGIGSTTQMGIRLDLRPMGPAGNLPTTVCPNGFVVFKDEKSFTDDEIAKLTPLVASDEFQRARTQHTTAYRAVLENRALGKDDASLAFMLLKAAWEAEEPGFEAQREGYLNAAYAAFAARAQASSTHDDAWWTSLLMRAEIERQRRHFPESIALLDALPLQELPPDDVKRDVAAQIRQHAAADDPKPAQFERNPAPKRGDD